MIEVNYLCTGPCTHACLLRGRRPAQGRHGPDRQRFVAADRGRLRQAPQDQGGGDPVAVRGAVAATLLPDGHSAGARARPELPVGRVRRRRFRLHRSRARIFRPCAGAGRGGRRRHGARRRADVLLQAGQGQVPPGAAAGARGRARLGRAQEARGGADGRVGRRAPRGPPARRLPGEARHAALPAGQEHDRVEDAARPAKRRQKNPVALLARAAPSLRRTTTTTTPSWRRRSRRASRSRRTARRRRLPDLPLADVRAFSIDDASTTEVDDAFSVRELPNGNYEVGVHIAVPALGIARGSPLDALARSRLSTVYMPGRKITMLPDDVVDAFTLAEGRIAPRVVAVRGSRARTALCCGTRRASTACRSPPICGSTRSARRSPPISPASPIRPGRRSCACSGSSRNGCRTPAARPISRASTTASMSIGTRRRRAAEAGHVRIVPRPRGSPLDKLMPSS